MNYSIYAESTPNPEVMKFVSNRMLADKSIEIKNIGEAHGISIAIELIKFPFVESIYMSSNFISITKNKNLEWESIAMQLRMFITDHLNSNEITNYTKDIKVVAENNINNKKYTNKKILTQNEKEVEAILNEYIAPAVESDGGAITLNYYKDNIVCVDLKGACSGCPSSTSTLKGGIETLLRQKISPEIEVIANEE
jgi:Fe-S cluster biogenesis protein NfuA